MARRKLVAINRAFPLGVPRAIQQEVNALKSLGKREGPHVVIGSDGRVFVKMRE